MTIQQLHFECSSLTLKFDKKVICDQFDFNCIGPGIIQIEGENGSGKTSLLKAFAGLMSAANSKILLNGITLEKIQRGHYSFFSTTSLGLCPELTGIEHIELISRSLGIDREIARKQIQEFCELSIFEDILQLQSENYSQGMKQMLRLFLHLFFKPQILFLDEPFVTMSPINRAFFERFIERLSIESLIFITEQKFANRPERHLKTIRMGEL